MKTLTIGDKPLSKISKEDVLHIAAIQGCCPSLEYWNYPEILDFDNTMFSDSVIIDHRSTRKQDGLISDTIVFFFHWKKLTYHYHRAGVTDRYYINRLYIESIKYLIQKGYDVPIY